MTIPMQRVKNQSGQLGVKKIQEFCGHFYMAKISIYFYSVANFAILSFETQLEFADCLSV